MRRDQQTIGFLGEPLLSPRLLTSRSDNQKRGLLFGCLFSQVGSNHFDLPSLFRDDHFGIERMETIPHVFVLQVALNLVRPR